MCFIDAPDAIAKDTAVCRIYNKVHKQRRGSGSSKQRVIGSSTTASTAPASLR